MFGNPSELTSPLTWIFLVLSGSSQGFHRAWNETKPPLTARFFGPVENDEPLPWFLNWLWDPVVHMSWTCSMARQRKSIFFTPPGIFFWSWQVNPKSHWKCLKHFALTVFPSLQMGSHPEFYGWTEGETQKDDIHPVPSDELRLFTFRLGPKPSARCAIATHCHPHVGAPTAFPARPPGFSTSDLNKKTSNSWSNSFLTFWFYVT